MLAGTLGNAFAEPLGDQTAIEVDATPTYAVEALAADHPNVVSWSLSQLRSLSQLSASG